MANPLPPLTALKAFEAVARHLSLKKAAEELNVTPAAVSHQIQQLEDLLGIPLLRRRHRGIEVTEAATFCIPKLQEGFNCLRQAVDRVRDRGSADVLTVGAAPSFASNWLMRRLHRFVTRFPAIDVHVSTRMRHVSRLPSGRRGEVQSVSGWTDEVDLVVVFGNGHYPGMRVDQLMPLSITPLCSPDLLRGPRALKRPADLHHHVLVHDDRGSLYEGLGFWDNWLQKAKVTGVDTTKGLHFMHSILAMGAAMDNQGIVASTPQLASVELANGRLVMPFSLQVPLASGYYVVSNEHSAKRNIVGTFRSWLLDEAAQQREPAARKRTGKGSGA
jgi:LysR family glycine cleavage system transcriptional activator